MAVPNLRRRNSSARERHYECGMRGIATYVLGDDQVRQKIQWFECKVLFVTNEASRVCVSRTISMVTGGQT